MLEGDFSVETYAKLRAGADKGDPIRPGQAEDSFLIKSIEGRARPHMPPRDEPQVPSEELARLKAWIVSGAKGPVRDESILQHLVVPQIQPRAGVSRPITATAMNPEGQILALGRFGQVQLRHLTDPAVELPELKGELPGKINALNFSPDGRVLVAATGVTGLTGVAYVWDVVSGELLQTLGGHRDVLYAAVFSPDNQRLATAGYDRMIRIWDLKSGKEQQAIAGHEGAVFDLAFHPDGTVLASASADETVKIWRVHDGLRLDTLNQPQGEQTAVLFSPDGNQVLSVGADKRIHQWRFISRDEPAVNPVMTSRFAHGSAIRTMTLTADGTGLLTAAADRTLKLWRLSDLTEIHSHKLQSDSVASLSAVSGTDTVYVARMDGSHERLDFSAVMSRLRNSESAEQVRSVQSATDESAQSSTAQIADAGKEAVVVEPTTFEEVEPNNTPKTALTVTLPAVVRGSIGQPADVDLVWFMAHAGEEIALEVDAARSGSKLDSHIEVLTADGEPVERVVLQAVRDSWFTFRGKDAFTSDDFRLHNWMEMELNEYLYANGEVVRLWLYPRGPDSGFKVYPGFGNRHTEFDTTALSHALGQPCYVVVPHPPGSQPAPNGLPVYRLNYENDDDSTRRWGADSRLLFTAPVTGEYLVRIRDVRGFGAAEGYPYTLTLRPSRPDFLVQLHGADLKVSPGNGREFRFTVTRLDGFQGAIRVDVENVPEGFQVSTPIVIEPGQFAAVGMIFAEPDAENPSEAEQEAIRITAQATINGQVRKQDLGSLGKLQLGDPAKVSVEILAYAEDGSLTEAHRYKPLEFALRPGETLKARVRAARHDFEGRIELGGDDSGRNLPHGLYVDNIGLNGLLIVEGQTERDFFVTAAPIARPGTRWFHLRTSADGGQASRPARITVLPHAAQASHP
jgi:hypothetical protein